MNSKSTVILVARSRIGLGGTPSDSRARSRRTIYPEARVRLGSDPGAQLRDVCAVRSSLCLWEGRRMPVRIVIADDHEVVRQGLHTILKARPDWQIVAEADNGREAVEQVKRLDPDVIILDVTMPVMSGLEASQELLKARPDCRILIFTMHDSKSLIKALRRAGARGYVLKSRAARDLIHAIEALLDGKTFFGPEPSNGEEEKDQGKRRNLILRTVLQFTPGMSFSQ